MHHLFKDSRTIELLHRGALGARGDHIDSYAELLNQQHYSETSVYKQLLVISHFSRWLQRHGIEVHKVDEGTLQRFLGPTPRKIRVQQGDEAALNRLLRLLRKQKIVPPKSPSLPLSPRQRVVAEFARYVIQERRLSQATLLNYQPFVDRFLFEQFKNGKVNFSSLRATDITGFVQRHAHRVGTARVKLLVAALRCFFRHLQQRGDITTNLAACVPTVAHWSFSTLPKILPAGAVRRVLRNCDRHSSIGIRNYAVLLLLSRLGLRACEVVALNLEDLDWDAGQITVKEKGGGSAPLPLPADVGEALAAYLRNGRPRCSSRRVFIRDRAPLTGFANSIAISTIVMRALKKAGVNSARKGAHVFRHTLATDLLRQGCTLDEIGELLRHQSPDTTAIYAKVDVAALHMLALPWPGGGR
jgi:site-specific recombinase XerD